MKISRNDNQKAPGFCLLFAFCLSVALLEAFAAENPSEGLKHVAPESIGLMPSRLKLIDEAVTAAIQADDIPGVVVLVARQGQIGYLKAFGYRSIQPSKESMTVDTIFDMSSLTKVMATTPSIMMLVESGILRLEDRVNHYLPNFSGGGKDNITLRQLLTHYSGLPPDFDLSKNWHGYTAALNELWDISTQSDPGKKFIYSDLNFIALGAIVQVVSDKTLDIFARENFFIPLGMNDTFFQVPASLQARTAPTESRRRTLEYLKGQPSADISNGILRGEVHDPTAWRMGGVAGHAGLFSSARDLAIFAQMLLNRGTYQGRRFFSPLTIQAMTTPKSPRNSLQVRGFGWDIDSIYSSPRGDLFKDGYGHTGFTGTSLWISPQTETFIVILSNRVHPHGKGQVNHLRGVIADIVASAISDPR